MSLHAPVIHGEALAPRRLDGRFNMKDRAKARTAAAKSTNFVVVRVLAKDTSAAAISPEVHKASPRRSRS